MWVSQARGRQPPPPASPLPDFIMDLTEKCIHPVAILSRIWPPTGMRGLKKTGDGRRS